MRAQGIPSHVRARRVPQRGRGRRPGHARAQDADRRAIELARIRGVSVVKCKLCCTLRAFVKNKRLRTQRDSLQTLQTAVTLGPTYLRLSAMYV